MTPNDKLKLLVEEIHKLKQELTQKARDGLMQCLKELFEMHPEVKKLQFTAYTPYWNDGEECTYWCNASCPDINVSDDEDEDEEYPKVSRKVADVFSKALSTIDDDTWYDIVGDHALVIITPQGIDVQEYEHE
jgi:hypothetical protein